MPLRLLVLTLLALAAWPPAAAQQRIGYVDSEVILQQMPEFRSAQARIDGLVQEWQAELDRLAGELETREREFEARALLFTDEERTRRRTGIDQARQAMTAYRTRHFGPQGELFREQQQALRPVQQRVLEAIEEVADRAGYDYVFDRSGEFLFLFAAPQHNLTARVMEELGLDPTTIPTSG